MMTPREQRYAVMGIIQEMTAKDDRIIVVLETEDGLLLQCRLGMLTEQEYNDLAIMLGGMNLEMKEGYSQSQKRGTVQLRRVEGYKAKPVTPDQTLDKKKGGKGRPKGSKNSRKSSGNTKRWKRGDTPPEE